MSSNDSPQAASQNSSGQKSTALFLTIALLAVNTLAVGYVIVISQQGELRQNNQYNSMKQQLDTLTTDLSQARSENTKLAEKIDTYEDILKEIRSGSPKTVVYNYHGKGSGTNQAQPGQVIDNEYEAVARTDTKNNTTPEVTNTPPTNNTVQNSPPTNPGSTNNTETTNNTSPTDSTPSNATTMTDAELLQQQSQVKVNPEQQARWNEYGIQAERYTQYFFDQNTEDLQNAFAEDFKKRMRPEVFQKYVTQVAEQTGGLKSFIGYQIEPGFDLTHITIATRSNKDTLFALHFSLNKRGKIEGIQPVPISDDKVKDYIPWSKPVIQDDDEDEIERD